MGLDWIRDAARRRPPGSRGNSPLYWWVWDRYDALTALLPPRPYWDGIAAGLIAQHPGDMASLIEDGDGKPPTGERLRKAVWAVGRDRQRGLGGERQGAVASAAAAVQAAPERAPEPEKPTEAAGEGPAAAADDGLDFLRFVGGRR